MAAIPGGVLIDASGTASGASQTIFSADHSRQLLMIQNLDPAADVWVNFGVPAVASQPSLRIGPGQTLRFDAISVVPTAAVNLLAVVGTPFVAKAG